MTYRKWEDTLLLHLGEIPESERREACEYYREIFGDKYDAGIDENKILEQFGDPKICAERILAERDESASKEYSTKKINATQSSRKPAKKFSISKWVGIFFLTTLVVIPLACVIISVIAAFAAVDIAAAALIIGGIIGTLASPLSFILGYTGWGVLSAAGTCLAVAGAGALLFPAFFIITKYSVISAIKLTKYAIGRCKE